MDTPPPACESPKTWELTLVEITDLEAVRRLWLDLEPRAKPCFYTSWVWIGTWLELLPPDVKTKLLQARIGGRVIGLAVVVDGPPHKRRGFEIYQTAHLHATGRPEIDIICIEHNDFLLDDAFADEARAAMCAYWLDHLPPATEVSLSWLSGTGWPEGIEKHSKRKISRVDSIHRSYLVDLRQVREAGGDYLKLIGKSTRSNIRRSISEYNKVGPLCLDDAHTIEDGMAWYEQLRAFHTARWNSRGRPGCFVHDFFYRFHRALLERHLVDGKIQLLRIRAGEHPIGYIYNFIHAGRVYAYMTGFHYGLIEKYSRPGLVSDALAIPYIASLGHDMYDYMAGDAPYKCELMTFEEKMTNTTMRTDSWRFRLDKALIKADRLRRRVGNVRRRLGRWCGIGQ